MLGGRTVISGEGDDEVTYVALANSWIVINVGGGPTDDKPTVTLETPPDPDHVNSFLNIRVGVHHLDHITCGQDGWDGGRVQRCLHRSDKFSGRTCCAQTMR
jgi:hypothetical protein